MTVLEMKDYIRKHKLNKPHLRLGMRRAEMIAGFKKEGRWKEVPKVKKQRSKPVKESPVKKPKLPPRPKAMATLKKAPVKKARRKTYYVGYDLLDQEEYELFGKGFGWKPEQSYGHFDSFSKKSLGEPEDEFWLNAHYRAAEKFDYNDRMYYKNY